MTLEEKMTAATSVLAKLPFAANPHEDRLGWAGEYLMAAIALDAGLTCAKPNPDRGTDWWVGTQHPIIVRGVQLPWWGLTVQVKASESWTRLQSGEISFPVEATCMKRLLLPVCPPYTLVLHARDKGKPIRLDQLYFVQLEDLPADAGRSLATRIHLTDRHKLTVESLTMRICKNFADGERATTLRETPHA